MEHQICFQGVTNAWYNALPLGNGKMGAMVYYENREIHIAMNHYDCYYRILPGYHSTGNSTDNSAGNSAGKGIWKDPAREEQDIGELKELAEKEWNNSNADRSHYLSSLHPDRPTGRPRYQGTSYPQAGELVLSFAESVETENSVLKLNIEKGEVTFRTGKEKQISLCIRVPGTADVVTLEYEQSVQGLWREAWIGLHQDRGQQAYRYIRGEEKDVMYIRCLKCQDKGTDGPGSHIRQSDNGKMPEGKEERNFLLESSLYIPGSVSRISYGKADLGSLPLWGSLAGSVQARKGGAIALARRAETDSRKWEEEHHSRWKQFWRSRVKLPDPFLETLWFLSVYQLACCSGEGGEYAQQACGLNGLWDIRKPSLWGSMWYWDVNIQSAFAGTFASNHLQQARVFCDAFLTYEKEAEEFGLRVYGRKGWALDYPHPLYHCIQPWCALYLWQYYRYSQDKEFLEGKAYPVFMKILSYFTEISCEDEEGVRHLSPDISPEQGPVAWDCTITVAALRQLAGYACEAAEVLKRPGEELTWLRELKRSLPGYAVTGDGSRWKDSALAQEELYLRHPSVLMPVYPCEEVHMYSPPQTLEIAKNTLKYARYHTETGTFGFGWLASCAARLGEGGSALGILYENGLDYLVRSNGLCCEETERFANYCVLTKPGLYLPAMCEASGGLTQTVCMMLLQEIGGVLYLFPAVPDGSDRLWENRTQYYTDDRYVEGRYEAWNQAEFEGLAAPGGFTVSACREQGRTVWVKVESRLGGLLHLALPGQLGEEAVQTGGRLTGQANALYLYEWQLHPGECLELGSHGGRQREASGVLIHEAAFTHRRIFLGENRHTAFYKAWDSFVCPYGFADMPRYRMTPYLFDFGLVTGKDYGDVYSPQLMLVNRSLLFPGGPVLAGTEMYDADRGCGFVEGAGLRTVDREGPDSVRRDFVEGEALAVFGVELPRGKYDMLVISGDEAEPSLTRLKLPGCGLGSGGEIMAAGRYQCRILPFIQEQDGPLLLRLDTEQGYRWKLNAIIIGKEYAAL